MQYCNDPLIFAGCAVKRPKENPSRFRTTTLTAAGPPLEAMELKGDLLICDLLQNGTESVDDMRVMNTDAKSHSAKTPDKCLHEADRSKKKIYLKVFLQQRRHFSPFVASVNRMLSLDATATLKMIASCIATKWQQTYSKMCGYVKIRVSITLVRATHRCIWWSRVPTHKISVQRLHWEDVAGINLFR